VAVVVLTVITTLEEEKVDNWGAGEVKSLFLTLLSLEVEISHRPAGW
jgi:hypothetical protein